METALIPSVESKLVTTLRYVSPIYTARFDRIREASDSDRPDMILFKEVEEDDILEWLKNNALFKIREPFPEHFHNDWGFVFANSGGMHVVNPSFAEVNPIAPIYRTTQDKTYERRLVIRSQPRNILLPEDLINALQERGFQQVDKFNKYEFR